MIEKALIFNSRHKDYACDSSMFGVDIYKNTRKFNELVHCVFF